MEVCCMLTSIILDMIANISILSTASYIFIKLIPNNKNIALNKKEKILLVGVAGVTSFLLMLFSIDLPNKALLDLRHIILILLIYLIFEFWVFWHHLILHVIRFLPISLFTLIRDWIL